MKYGILPREICGSAHPSCVGLLLAAVLLWMVLRWSELYAERKGAAGYPLNKLDGWPSLVEVVAGDVLARASARLLCFMPQDEEEGEWKSRTLVHSRRLATLFCRSSSAADLAIVMAILPLLAMVVGRPSLATCCWPFFLHAEELQLRRGISQQSLPKWFVPDACFAALAAEFIGVAVQKCSDDLIAFLVPFRVLFVKVVVLDVISYFLRTLL